MTGKSVFLDIKDNRHYYEFFMNRFSCSNLGTLKFSLKLTSVDVDVSMDMSMDESLDMGMDINMDVSKFDL